VGVIQTKEAIMTNAAHTPGPWDYDNYADHVSYFSDASKRQGDYDFRVEFPDDMPETEAEANARLIAAAPELLVHSILVLRMLPHYGVLNEVGMAELRQTIFKALGIEADKFDARGFEDTIAKAKTA
jgi:hypothetical protein